jgi:hypothetical protein
VLGSTVFMLCACGDRHRPDDGAKFDLAVGETEGTDCPPDNVAGEEAFGDPFDLARAVRGEAPCGPISIRARGAISSTSSSTVPRRAPTA